MSPGSRLEARQTRASISKNSSYFRDNRDYQRNIQELDTYAAIRFRLNQSLQGIDRLLDIGNGGVFDYDTDLVREIVALDLFFEDGAAPGNGAKNVAYKTGSALSIHEPDESFDGVLIAMLLHHLVGNTVRDSLRNVRTAVREAYRVLRPGGRLIVIESCVPNWFYRFEKAVFAVAGPVINALLAHPATLQYPARLIQEVIGECASGIEILEIPKGKYVLQFHCKIPSRFTPVMPFRFVALKETLANEVGGATKSS
jgi:SAM-dependent methyltransferase